MLGEPAVAQGFHAAFRGEAPVQVAEEAEQPVGRDGLFQEIPGARAKRRDGVRDPAHPRNDDDGQLRRGQDVHAVFGAEVEVGKDGVYAALKGTAQTAKVEAAAETHEVYVLGPDLKAREHYADYGRARDIMIDATHRKHAPWHVVDFNDQRRGRLNLIRHLLDHVPERRLPEKPFYLPPLKGKPARERYAGAVRPIRGRF